MSFFNNNNRQEAVIKADEKLIKSMCLYYGFPIAINGAWDINVAVDIYKKYDIIVFGDQYQHPSHEANADTTKIIAKLREAKKEVFGYIPIGLDQSWEDSNLGMDTIKAYIDEWYVMKVSGIFLDEFGFDYKVTRERQNEIVDYCHAKGMNVIANSWNIDYVFKTENVYLDWIDFNGNPNNIRPSINSNDYYLFENLFYNFDDKGRGNQEASDQWRVYEAVRYLQEAQAEYGGKTFKEEFKTKTIGLDAILTNDKNKFANGYIGSIILNLDGYCASPNTWGASDPNYIHYEKPKIDLPSNYTKGLTRVTDYSGTTYAKYENSVSDTQLELIWKPYSSDRTNPDKGVRKVTINNRSPYIVDDLTDNQGDLSQLQTNNKTNLVSALNEVFQNADSGKDAIYNAIVGKGVTPASKDFADLKSAIESI